MINTNNLKTKVRDYSKGKIYKIEALNGESDDIYIGSTTKEYLSQRLATHRNGYNTWLKGKRDKVTSFELFDKYGIDNCIIVLLETVNASSLDELHAREAHYIKSLKCVNKMIPLRTIKEWYIDNKETVNQKNKEWKHSNKELIKEQDKEYRLKNKERIKQKCKEYNDKNKERFKQQDKEWYDINKDIINEARKLKIECVCGSIHRKADLSKHIKTIKHQTFIQQQTEITL